jgi:hypothetical protein
MALIIGGKKTYLYDAIVDDYVQAFKQTTLYYQFKKGGPFIQGLNRSELLLCRATQFGDPTQLVNVVQRYSLSSSFTTIITHLEGD